MTQNQKMRDFVKSLENNQFSKEQEAWHCRLPAVQTSLQRSFKEIREPPTIFGESPSIFRKSPKTLGETSKSPKDLHVVHRMFTMMRVWQSPAITSRQRKVQWFPRAWLLIRISMTRISGQTELIPPCIVRGLDSRLNFCVWTTSLRSRLLCAYPVWLPFSVHGKAKMSPERELRLICWLTVATGWLTSAKQSSLLAYMQSPKARNRNWRIR